MEGFDWKKVLNTGGQPQPEGQPVPPAEAETETELASVGETTSDAAAEAPAPAPAIPTVSSDDLAAALSAIGKPLASPVEPVASAEPEEPVTPAPVSAAEDDLPFAEHERILEEATKSGVEPKLNPFAMPDPPAASVTPPAGMPPIQRPEAISAVEPPKPSAGAPVGPPPLDAPAVAPPAGPPPGDLPAAKAPVGPPPLNDVFAKPEPVAPAAPVGPPPLDAFKTEPPVAEPPKLDLVSNEAPPAAPPAAPVDPEKERLLSLFTKPVEKEVKPDLSAPPTLSQLNSADANATQFDAHKIGDASRSKYDGGQPIADVHIDEVLRMAVERRCSDIHFSTGLPPMIRVDGEVQSLPYAPLQPADIRRLLYDTLDDDRLQKFETTKELDFSYPVKGLGRFRVNMFVQRGSVGGVLRVIPQRIPAFEELGLPPIIREISKRTSGLILVTGPTGSGKSTTIASMIDDINATLKGHIMTIEDPIEYLHTHKQCIVNQRELHTDTFSFHNALRAVLREDPDIILVGELRDLETIEAALTLAETGHLVFGTLHTRSAPATIDRIIDVFPPESQEQIRVLLSNTLEGVVSQQLLPKLGGGRCAAIEIMMGTAAIRNLIREGKTHQMQSIIETSGNIGMQTMDATLAELYRSGKCEFEECMMRAIDKETFSRLARAA